LDVVGLCRPPEITLAMEVADLQLQLLKDVAAGYCPSFTASHLKIMIEVAVSGEYVHPWRLLRHLYAARLDQVLTELAESDVQRQVETGRKDNKDRGKAAGDQQEAESTEADQSDGRTQYHNPAAGGSSSKRHRNRKSDGKARRGLYETGGWVGEEEEEDDVPASQSRIESADPLGGNSSKRRKGGNEGGEDAGSESGEEEENGRQSPLRASIAAGLARLSDRRRHLREILLDIAAPSASDEEGGASADLNESSGNVSTSGSGNRLFGSSSGASSSDEDNAGNNSGAAAVQKAWLQRRGAKLPAGGVPSNVLALISSAASSWASASNAHSVIDSLQAPFTLQRLSEVLCCPSPQYNTCGKFLNAVEKVSSRRIA
jgi:PPP4R2